MEQITEELVKGASSLAALMKMMSDAVFKISSELKAKPCWEEGSSGIYFGRNWGDYWCGVYHNDAVRLVFQAYRLERIPEEGWYPKVEGKAKDTVWRCDLNLSEDKFFDACLDEQSRRVEEFIESKFWQAEKGRAPKD